MSRQRLASLQSLSNSASSARLLNLAAVTSRDWDDLEFRSLPFFETPMLNASLILKHSLRSHERAEFDRPRSIATKIIIPFDRNNLAIGGRSVLVGQRGWIEQLEALTSRPSTLERDCEVLRALDELPSLDAFLVREHLGRRGFKVGACYLASSDADIDRMRKIVASEVEPLIGRAFSGAKNSRHTAKLALALLTNQADSNLEPLRKTLRLEGAAYTEGIFAWCGFLYYKWAATSLRGKLLRVVREICDLKTDAKCDPGTAAEVARAKRRLMDRIEAGERSAVKVLAAYDNAFWALVRRDDPSVFRQFLLDAPALFMSLGEAVGGLSHITSYWSYRFPDGAPLVASGSEALEIVREFEASLPPVQAEHAPNQSPSSVHARSRGVSTL